MINILKLVLASLFVLLFTACKKYPENTLWFKNPKNLSFMQGNMTHYIVNGVDSIDYLGNYFYPDNNNLPYNHPFNDVKIVSYTAKDKGFYEVTFNSPENYGTDIIQSLHYSYEDKGKKIKISGTKKYWKHLRKIFL